MQLPCYMIKFKDLIFTIQISHILKYTKNIYFFKLEDLQEIH